MQLKENANLSDRYYIEAPEDFEDAKKFDYAVTEMNLVTPESDWYDFDNTFLATVSEIRAMIEEYGVEPIVYEGFDEENGPNERVYDVNSLAFDADPLDECVCAGQACGTGTISDFVPEKMRGVKDIHEEDDKFAESKNSMENKKMITKEKLIESFKRVMETKEVPAENPNNYFYGKAEKNIEYSKVNPDNMKVNKKLPENKMKEAFDFDERDDPLFGYGEDDYFETSPTLDINDFDERDDPLYGYGEDDYFFESSKCKVMPRAIRESRALPGGMLNSEEKTAYEDFLRERHLKQDKVKAKEFGKNKLGLYDDDCGENGWHNWDGTKIK